MLAVISSIWVTFVPIVLINAILLISYLSYVFWFGKIKKREFEGAKSKGSMLIGSKTREWWFWTTDPIVRLFVRLHMGPNVITVIGVLISSVSGILFAYGWFGYAGWVMVFGASFDMFDGRVARMTGQTSRSGAFFDSVTDRIGEGVCYLGVAIYFRESWMLIFVIAALIGSTMVSYTRSRGETFGVDCSVGSMQRPERIVFLGVAAIFSPVVSVILKSWIAVPPPVLVMLSVIFIAVMTIGTAAYRMIYIMNELDTKDEREKESLPQIITKLSTHAGREEIWDKARYGYDRTKSSFSHVVLFHVGGMDVDYFHALLAAGDLPNISKYLVERGGEYKAVGAFPSTTGPAVAPFVTGCFPGTCDIPGVRWFDRRVPSGRVITMSRFRDYLGWGAYAMDYDLSKSVRTIFEYSRQAVNIFGLLNRGCGFVRDPAFFRLHSHFQHAREAIDLNEADEAAFKWFSSALRRETDFVLYSLPPQALIKSKGDDDGVVRESYRRLDKSVGRAVDLLIKRGMFDDTCLMFSADSSQIAKKSNFELNEFLSERFNVIPKNGRMRDWSNADVISLLSGTSASHLYMKNNNSWSDRVFFEDMERKGLVGSLLEREEIDMLAGRSVEGGIIVQSSMGHAHILEDADGRITYMIKGGDPFGYTDMPQVLNASESLSSTFDSKYPDGIVQMIQLFRSRRAGDLVLSAGMDVSLLSGDSNDSDICTHGSLSREHVLVPFLSSFSLDDQPMRTVDIFATILKALGIESIHSMDGVGAEYLNKKAAVIPA